MPLPAAAAAALPEDRAAASREIGALLPDAWPQVDLLDVLPMQAAAADVGAERFGVWVLVERETNTVVGDIGFFGPPLGQTVEIGFSVIPDRRRRGYASEAARALVDWALRQPGIGEVTARSDVENEASARVLTRAAFDRVGVTGGTIRWRRRSPGR
jgi:ribosomal-protein-alanine N-acetyltransferase